MGSYDFGAKFQNLKDLDDFEVDADDDNTNGEYSRRHSNSQCSYKGANSDESVGKNLDQNPAEDDKDKNETEPNIAKIKEQCQNHQEETQVETAAKVGKKPVKVHWTKVAVNKILKENLIENGSTIGEHSKQLLAIQDKLKEKPDKAAKSKDEKPSGFIPVGTPKRPPHTRFRRGSTPTELAKLLKAHKQQQEQHSSETKFHGRIQNIFNNFGYISCHHLDTNVFFVPSHIESAYGDDSTIPWTELLKSVLKGDSVEFEAVAQPEKNGCKWIATKVWLLKQNSRPSSAQDIIGSKDFGVKEPSSPLALSSSPLPILPHPVASRLYNYTSNRNQNQTLISTTCRETISDNELNAFLKATVNNMKNPASMAMLDEFCSGSEMISERERLEEFETGKVQQNVKRSRFLDNLSGRALLQLQDIRQLIIGQQNNVDENYTNFDCNDKNSNSMCTFQQRAETIMEFSIKQIFWRWDKRILDTIIDQP